VTVSVLDINTAVEQVYTLSDRKWALILAYEQNRKNMNWWMYKAKADYPITETKNGYQLGSFWVRREG
jgi:ABC-type maltose transport system permease subunit